MLWFANCYEVGRREDRRCFGSTSVVSRQVQNVFGTVLRHDHSVAWAK